MVTTSIMNQCNYQMVCGMPGNLGARKCVFTFLHIKNPVHNVPRPFVIGTARRAQANNHRCSCRNARLGRMRSNVASLYEKSGMVAVFGKPYYAVQLPIVN